MKKCKKCGEDLPNRLLVDGKVKNISKRKFCVKCSPFNSHNTSKYPAKIGFKVCTKCKRELDASKFSKKNDRILYSFCKECLYDQQSSIDRKKKQEAVTYKGGKCLRCGYNKYFGALDFHHSDPSKKDPNFRQLRKRKIEEYKVELDK